MRDLNIPIGKVTPGVVYQETSKTLTIEGQSYPENARSFYRPVLDWLQEAVAASDAELLVSVHLLYLNTSSISVFMTLFAILETAARHGAKLRVEWLFDRENELSWEMGEEFRDQVKLPFQLREVD